MLWAFCAGYVLFRNFTSNWFSLKSKWHTDTNQWKVESRWTKKLDLKISISKKTQMVNTVNGKCFQINSKTDSRNFYKDKWTLIKSLSKRKNEFQKYIDNEYILTEWLMRNYKADFRQTLKDCNILQVTQFLEIQRTRITENILLSKNFGNF